MTKFREPWTATALRTGLLALAIGLVAGGIGRRLALVPLATVLALWFTLGGHFAELLFRNRIGVAVGSRPSRYVPVRLLYWFAVGSLLYAGALATRALLTGRPSVPWPWWVGGAGFGAAELAVHALMRARGLENLYDGTG